MTLIKKGVWLLAFKVCDKIRKFNFASLRNEEKCKVFYIILEKQASSASLKENSKK